MEDELHNYVSTVMFRGTLCINIYGMHAKVHNSRHRFEINTNFHSSLDLCDLNYQVSSLLKVTELVYTVFY